MLRVNEALERIVSRTRTLGSKKVSVEEALGHVLAEDIRTPGDMPPFDQAAMDGYAVGSHGYEFRVLEGEIKAGDEPWDAPLMPGDAVRIYTGAPVPPGTYAVIPQEYVEVLNGKIKSTKVIAEGENVRPRGEEARKGETILPSGTFITPPIVGLLASMGYTHVKVIKKPKVAVITTGSELVDPTPSPPPGRVVDSNMYQITATLRAWGLEVAYRKRVGDDLPSLIKAVNEALEVANIVITSGGVSVGKYDLIREVAEELGITQTFWRVAQKPGKPMFFGIKGRKLVFGLPGNPVAVSVCMYVYVKTAVRRMMGIKDSVLDNFVYAILAKTMNKKGKRLEFVRGHMFYTEDRKYLPIVKPIAKRGSHMLTSLRDANALIVLPEDRNYFEHCMDVKVLPLRWFSINE